MDPSKLQYFPLAWPNFSLLAGILVVLVAPFPGSELPFRRSCRRCRQQSSLYCRRAAAPLAYIGGSLGALIGADMSAISKGRGRAGGRDASGA
jgi:hypothetical protein